MKILHIHENYEIKGGSEVYIRDLISELQERNIVSDWFAIQTNGKDYKIHFNMIEQTNLSHHSLFESLDTFCSDKKYDLVHMHGISDIEVIEYFLDRYPVVRSMHEPRLICPGYGKFLVSSLEPCTEKFGLHCLYKAYTEKCQLSRNPVNVVSSYKRVKYEVNEASLKYKAIITMSDYVKDEAIRGGIDENSIYTIPYFTKFKLLYREFSASEKRILFVGRLNVTKGIVFLIKAMILLLKNTNDVYLDIVGDGELKDELLTLIESENMETKIQLHGWKSSEEISKLMSDSYLLAFPSIYPEAFGIVGIEAFAHSRPVVGFDVGGVSTWLKDGVNGYLVENKNVDQFRERIKSLLDDKKVHEEFTRNAYESYQNNFTAENHVDKLIQIYKESLLK